MENAFARKCDYYISLMHISSKFSPFPYIAGATIVVTPTNALLQTLMFSLIVNQL